ncbi:MAG TPA: 1,2-phenylacetyl-CoA epoxidase subunit PaaD [Gemmatimonadaceae bacterium]
MSANTATREEILGILSQVKDPEIPIIDIVELGIVRDVAFEGDGIRVDITPTYSGCPAMQVIERDIVSTLDAHGYANARVHTVYSPAWTTDWITDEAKTKLRDYGIAPPRIGSDSAGGIAELVSLRRAQPTVECPFCGSANTSLKSEFGSTACKSIHFCNSCRQPFDHFKAF